MNEMAGGSYMRMDIPFAYISTLGCDQYSIPLLK